MYPIYLNVGHAKNGDGYHLYDITKNVGEVEKQTSVFERVSDLRSKNDLPTNSSIPHADPTVKNKLSFSSPQSDIDAIADDIPLRHVDGTVRTYAEYRAGKAAEPSAAKTQQDFTPAPGTDKSPLDEKDIAEIVNAEGNKRAHRYRPICHRTKKDAVPKNRICVNFNIRVQRST